jgi:polysaccharide biosynthesis transport protein
MGSAVETVRYLKILWQRIWIIAIVAIAAAAAAFLLARNAPDQYTATSKMRVIPAGGFGALDYASILYFDRLVSTYAELLVSDIVTVPARQRLSLEQLPRYTIELVPQTELMRLDVTSTDPIEAANVANTLTELLVEQNQAVIGNTFDRLSQDIQTQIDQLNAEISALQAEQSILLNEIPQNTVRVGEIDRSISSRQSNLDNLSGTLFQARLQQQAQSSALTIVQRASVPEYPSGTGPTRTAVLSGVVGLMGGIALAFLLEALNPRLHTNRQIETLLGANIIGRIPGIRRKNRKDVFAGDIIAAESFRRLRTNVASGHETPMRLILVASSIPGEGKSTIAANLARSFARNQQSVVLVDCDLRRPTQHAIFGVSNEGDSLSNLLLDKISVDDAAEGVGLQNLKLIPAGMSGYNSTELLASQKMRALTDNLLEHFDVVIFDGPAILAAPDSVALASLVDGVLFIVDPKRISQHMVGMAREQLEQVGANVMGVVLNRVRPDKVTQWRKYYPSAKPVR